jgi:hypothetical protein
MIKMNSCGERGSPCHRWAICILREPFKRMRVEAEEAVGQRIDTWK